MTNGILHFALNKDNEAQDLFLDCMEFGSKIGADPRIRKECLTRLIKILNKKYENEDR